MKVKKNKLEWTVFGVGTILVVSLMSVLVHQAVKSEGDEPDLSVVFGAPEPSGEMVRYTMTVRNSGNATATDVHVVVGMRQGGGIGERASALLEFVPRRSEREAEILFRDTGAGGADPVALSLTWQTE